MIIKKFRIWNYKSIIDSGDCYPSNKVTILAGKNEAGKTSILEALEDFNKDRDIREKAIPILDEEKQPKIAIWFEINKQSLEKVFEEIGHTLEVKDSTLIHIEKNYPSSYTLGEDTDNLGLTDTPNIDSDQILEDINEDLNRIASILVAHTELNSVIPVFDPSDLLKTKVGFEELREKVSSIAIPEPDSSTFIPSIDHVIEICQKYIDSLSQKEKFLQEIKEFIPNFILFSSFNDVFPNVVELSQLETNEWVNDLSTISNLNTTIVTSSNDRKKVDHKTQLNLNINEEFKKFWEQDLSSLYVDWDNEKLYFWILEDGHHFEPEIRSQGKRWYLAFYIKVTARALEVQRNVILIDEPGLYLHAQAQRDVLKKLEDASQYAQVIFSTHSPYLIEADKLERIRLIQRDDKKGTVIENKIHKVADKETLTPILTAIGLEMNNNISQIDRINNIIVEGPSDFYYLQLFKKLMKIEDLNFIFGGGAGNMPKVGTILQGWGCNVIYLYDNDKGMTDALKNIKAEWVTTTKEIISKIPVDGSIEDIFSQSDYKKLIINDEKSKFTTKNSEYAKSSKRDKVLDSKLLLESHNSKMVFDKTSMDNIKKLLDEITKKFSKPTSPS